MKNVLIGKYRFSTALYTIKHCVKLFYMSHFTNTFKEVVNFIRARGLNHRQFISLLENVGAEHTDVLYLLSLPWFS
jgi:hypothetical protein